MILIADTSPLNYLVQIDHFHIVERLYRPHHHSRSCLQRVNRPPNTPENALKRSQIQTGDVLVTIAGTIGRAGVVPDNAPALNCNQAVAIVRPNEEVFRPFLRMWLESSDAQNQMRSATVTGTISNLSLTQIGNLAIPLPPLADQRRIAEVLDRAEELRAKRRTALTQLDSLVQSLFLNLLLQAGRDVSTVSIEDGMEAIIDYRGKSPTKTESGIPS